MLKYFLKRALAYLLDCLLCYSIIMLVVQWAILSPIRESMGITDEWFSNSLNLELYVLVSISFPVWMYFAYFDSNKFRATFGKRLMKLSVCDCRGRKLVLGKSLLRTVLKLLPWELIHLGIVFPTPMYFEEEPSIRTLTLVGTFLFIVYALSIFFNSDRQSIYEKLIGTNVIEFKS